MEHYRRKYSVLFCLISFLVLLFISCKNEVPASVREPKGLSGDHFLNELENIRESSPDIDGYSSLRSKALLQSANRFISNVENSFDKLTDEQWSKVDIRIREYESEYGELRDKMTQEEKDVFNRLMGNYLALKARKAAVDLEKGLQDAKSKAEGFLEKIKEIN